MNVDVYKITLQVVDFDGLGRKGLVDAIENVSYPNRCLSPQVRAVESRNVDWSDSHPLNKVKTAAPEFERLFSAPEELETCPKSWYEGIAFEGKVVSDLVLLNLTAKAYGYKAHPMYNSYVINSAGYHAYDKGWVPWDPLRKGQDALRLASKLGMTVRVLLQHKVTVVECEGITAVQHGEDSDAATRLAIVLAAAKIGKAMK